MTGKSTATVETLTAEVRVLMVGSRQVTLSVVRQLDIAKPDQIMPFGRVRAARDFGAGDIEVVGSVNGVLARSVACKTTHRCYAHARGDGSYHKHCPEFVPGGLNGDHADHSWWSYSPGEETYAEWAALPLIVLAGLR
jgi:hypothetical protein